MEAIGSENGADGGVPRNTIHHDDCFNILPRIEKKSVNLVLVDLPYGEIDCVWDEKINLDKMWIELKRVGTNNCIYAFFCSSRFGAELINSNPAWYAYDLVWKKTQAVGFLNANVCPLRSHEMIYIFKKKNKPKGCKSVYHPQKTKGEPYNRKYDGKYDTKKSHNDESAYGRQKEGKRKNVINEGDRFPISVLEFKKERETGHVTEKPVGLCEWLINSYSNQGDLVLDFCMGSGTTCVACINTKRDYIGVEMTEKWFKVSSDRIRGTPVPAPDTPTMVDEIPLEIVEDDLE
jgi:DNA modification methylase